MANFETPDPLTASAGQKPKIQVRPDPFIGRIVRNRYRINSRIARGGMSSVYLARDVRESVLRAVKILRSDLVLERRLRLRFLNESRAVARINHPAVVTIEDVGETEDGNLCIVMDYVVGRSLRKKLAHGPLQVKEAISIIECVADGLEAAHEQGVIHRDLKPENVLLPSKPTSKDACVKLVDFGIARIIDAPRITTTQHVMGTPHYIAPEQAMGKEVDHRADVYAFGVMLYEMLTGRLPFYGDDPDILLRQHISTPPPPLQSHGAAKNIPKQLRFLVMRCLSKSPQDRPQSMSDIRKSLATIN